MRSFLKLDSTLISYVSQLRQVLAALNLSGSAPSTYFRLRPRPPIVIRCRFGSALVTSPKAFLRCVFGKALFIEFSALKRLTLSIRKSVAGTMTVVAASLIFLHTRDSMISSGPPMYPRMLATTSVLSALIEGQLSLVAIVMFQAQIDEGTFGFGSFGADESAGSTFYGHCTGTMWYSRSLRKKSKNGFSSP
jgi:hypothetical protein